ncbi:MAG: glycosyl hydrolase [Cyclobacteriaceae bacterium]
MRKSALLLLLLYMTGFTFLHAQKRSKTQTPAAKQPLDEISLKGLKWRNVGPALTSGRVADLAVNPKNPYEYYVATASGGVWKTKNAGVTYTPIFDQQGSYSVGCVTIDPNNYNVVWIGSGENNGQRSVAYGDGVYKSSDGGKSWKNMGLTNSEHIGKIVVHPDNSDVVFVAALGPLWKKGGDRGLYKTSDGGKTWEVILKTDEHTGVNEVIIDPTDPSIMYASTHQRRRHVFTYVSGGPGSSLYKSKDGGKTWKKAVSGLPTVELGRIGLAMSPANPGILYAIVEAADGKGGFYRSTNQGASWEKRSSHSTSGNYYQEIIADPVDENIIYSMDTWMKVSRDGGKTFTNVGEDTKHVDNHCIWIDPNNNEHLLVGCDGGIYETFDVGKTWDFKANLPITQFYKVALDNDQPFYNIYGGTQDNFSLGGPSRVVTDHGITNQDWIITHGGDGFESQVDPNNPDIVYAQSQYGVLVRYDKKSGEEVGIQPKPGKNENSFRWNWDAPLAVSKHQEGRLYFAANKVFKSDDYGNSWEVISDDLSRQIDRNTLTVYDRVLSIDAVAKNGSTSPYGTIVALSESPIDANFLAIGTDDGLIHLSEDGGNNWRKIDNIAGVPQRSYVNSIYLSQHDANVMYAAFNHHKYGDFKPYIYRSGDKGKTWTKISNNLPEKGSVYAIEEDPKNGNLLFCGTEFGVFFSPDGGMRWKELGSGLPTIAVRDIAIQPRENDLVLATFGRGFYVLDDYSALRNIKNANPVEKAVIYPIRTALAWEKSTPLGLPGKAFQGDNFYTADNLGPEAMITYYYDETFQSLKDQRKNREKELIKSRKDTPYPSYEALRKETEEDTPQLLFTIRDSEGKVVKKEFRKPAKGLQRFHWNLRYVPQSPVSFRKPAFYNPFAGQPEGTLVNPGTYTVDMSLYRDGDVTRLTDPVSFEVKALDNTVMPAEDRKAKTEFQRDVAALSSELQITQRIMSEISDKLKHMKEAVKLAEQPMGSMARDIKAIEKAMNEINTDLYGDPIKRRLDIDEPMSPANRIGSITYEQKYSTAAPTTTHRENYQIAKEEFEQIQKRLIALYRNDVIALEKALMNSGAPYTPGRALLNLN